MKNFIVILGLLFCQNAWSGYDAGPANSVFVVPPGGGRAKMGSVNLGSSVAVGSSILGFLNGGCNASSAAGCFLNIAPTASSAGQTIVWNGSAWTAGASVAAAPPIVQRFTFEGVPQTGTLSTSSPCITAMSGTAGINFGAGIIDTTNNAAISPMTTVVAVPGICASGQVQMSANAALAETGDALVFGSEPITSATTSTATVCMTSVGSTVGIVPGAPVVDLSSPSSLSANTVVVGVPGICLSGQIQISNNPVVSEGGDTFMFGGVITAPSSPSALYFDIQMAGGGGGGNNGATGGTTFFDGSLLTATGGNGGGNPQGGQGAGIATVNAPAIAVVVVNGATGASGVSGIGASNIGPSTGPGGSTAFGGAGSGVYGATGTSAAPDTGSGGGGGPQTGGTGGQSSGSGQAGAYLEALLNSPSGTYGYIVGRGGANGGNAGNGGSGVIIVTSHFQ